VADGVEWELCELEAADETSLREAYRNIYITEYVNAEIRDWHGRRVLFHRFTFDHAFSAATNYRTSAGIHDVALSLPRAQRIYWIRKTLVTEDLDVDVIGQVRSDNRGRPRRRRTLIVLDNRYVVVLEVSARKDCDFEFVTAFPATAAYLMDIRRGSSVVEKRRRKRKPQSCGD
jgi:hypothetical protein